MKFDYKKLADPEFFMEGTIPAHSDHKIYASEQECKEQNSSFYMSLNGLWKYDYAVNVKKAPKGFEKEDYDCKEWDDIAVPSCIQMKGYDAPQYANTQYPWDGREEIDPGQIPESFNPVSSYVKYITLPDHMKGKTIYLSFQGVESAMILWINGSYVGYREDSFTPSEFDITPFLKDGENRIAVQVMKWASGSWCEDQDFFRFSGIHRDVYLYAVPEVHVQNLEIVSTLDADYEDATLDIRMEASQKGMVSFCLSKDGKEILKKEQLLMEEMSKCTFAVKNPEKWSAEQPALYELLITVESSKGTVQEVISQWIGFRKFEMNDGVMCLNGKRIVFQGVNRHEFSSQGGRVVTREQMEKDIITMKQNNINAIRTCHYPNPSYLYELCDHYGLYVIDETNLETHGIWDMIMLNRAGLEDALPGDRPEWQELVLDRARSMYERDKNHACILIWSCGNESYGGKDIYEMAQAFHKWDPSRLVHYEGIFRDRRYPGTSDMESQMYPSVADIIAFLKEHREKPFICCEYTHAMGNSCGAMHKYTDLTETEPLYQGGFIWDYIDQSITKTDRYGKTYQAYGGDFDDHPCDYNFSGNGIVYGEDRDPSPKMQEVKYNYRSLRVQIDEDRFTVKNSYLVTDANAFECVASLEKNGKHLKKHTIKVAVAPLSSETFPLPFEIPEEKGIYTLTISFRLKEDHLWAKKGHEVSFGQKIYENHAKEKECEEAFQVIHGRRNLGVKGKQFEVLFSYLNEAFVSYRWKGKELLKTAVKPNFWRAPIDNDWGSKMPSRYAQWKAASLYAYYQDPFPEVEEGTNLVRVTFTYHLPTVPASECKLSYRIFGNGEVKVKLTYDPVKELGDMPEFGVMFKMDADYSNLEWFGLGPDETYVDRCKGAKLGIYKNKVADNMAKYLVPQECGNKVGVYYAKVTDESGTGFLVSGENLSFSALPYTPSELESAAHPNELPPVHYTVVRVAKQQMGVGGDDSWQAETHPEYLIDIRKKLEFEFTLKGIS